MFGTRTHKKRRSARVAEIGAASSVRGRLGEALRDRSLVLRLLMCLTALVLLMIVVESWRAPFPYRLGDHREHGILARVTFKRVNTFETERARKQAAEAVPPVFSRKPNADNRNLPARLRRDLQRIKRAGSLEDVDAQTRRVFGLLPVNDPAGPGPKRSQAVIESQFRSLKNSTDGDRGIGNDGLQAVLEDFSALISPLSAYGVIDPADLSRHDIGVSDEIGIVDPDDPSETMIVPVTDVLLVDMLSDQGALGRNWAGWANLVSIREPLERWLESNVVPTLRYDSEATGRAQQAARAEVPEITDSFEEGDVLVAPGQVIDEERLSLLKSEFNEVERQVPASQRLIRLATVFVMILVLAALNGYYLIHNEPVILRRVGRLALYLSAIVVAVALGRLMSFDPWRAEIIPLVLTVMVFAVAYNQILATLTAFTLALILTLSTTASLGNFALLMTVSAIAVIPLKHIASRSTLVKTGFATAIAYILVSWGMGVIEAQTPSVLWNDRSLLVASLRGAGWCLVAGYLVAGSLPFVEAAFGMVTDISLLEMSDVSHPLLQELVRRAPGTYNHSIAVATIGEAAADRIGANGLLVRVGAYFHDIGKMLKPGYFIENMTEGAENRHDHLAPAMSTLIIIGHVKDGADLARQHNLPQTLIDFIEQHHGTTLVQYFYHEASKLAGQKLDRRTDVEESSFRYPGPKPQSREAGVMMLADAVESASRTLVEPTPKRIESLVHEVTMARLLDGQFDESSLTLSEIHAVQDSLTKSLIAIYHGRIQYPEQRTA